MELDNVPAVFHKFPLVLRALEELRMLGQTELERERYEARRKAQLDYNTGLKVAHLEGHAAGRSEGRAEGRAEGQQAIIALIHGSERLLSRPLTAAEKLAGLPLSELTQLAEKLQTELVKKV
jgi:flagellar biosynthesis/type III secretory pathway protein FliH